MYDLRNDIKELEKSELKTFNLAFIANPTLLILQYLYDNDIIVNITNPRGKKFYENFRDGKISTAYGFMRKYKIASYNGTIHYDDQTFKQDLLTKPIFSDLYDFVKDKEVENISTLFHIINEMDRNIRNHSGYKDSENKDYYFSIQHYPKSNEMVFTLLDDGVGIKHNLDFQYKNAIEKKEVPPYTTIGTYACTNGITSKSNHCAVHGDGKNSGYGLYMLRMLGAFGGNSMQIVADNRVYKVKHRTKEKTLQSDIKIDNENLRKITFVTAKLKLVSLDQQLKEVETSAKNMSGKSRVIPLKNEEIHQLFEQKN